MIDTAAESALLAIRNRLHALDIPADEVPDDLLDVAVGGSLMPSLPGWTPARARDWAALAIDRPIVAKMMIDWTNRNANRLANLEWITAWLTIAVPGLILSMGRRDFGPDEDFGREVAETRDQVNLSGSARIDEMRVNGALDATLAHLNHIPRPWHAELTRAIAAARRGALPATTFHLTDWTRSGSQLWAEAGTVIPVDPLETVANIRVAPPILDDILGRTNAASFCGAEPDELILQALGTELGEWDSRDGPRIHLSYDFRFRPGLPWSRSPGSPFDPETWAAGDRRSDRLEFRDVAGRPAYESADFYELP
jgi:hypothetical protein